MASMDAEFLEYNVDNIYKNLLQAEYHAKNIVSGRLEPSHLSCINKHLAFVEGEAEEATAHCEIAKPDTCDFFREFMIKVRKLRNRIRKEGAGPELQSEIRELRKEIESRFTEYDTSECKVCKLIDDVVEKALNDFKDKNKEGSNMVEQEHKEEPLILLEEDEETNMAFYRDNLKDLKIQIVRMLKEWKLEAVTDVLGLLLDSIQEAEKYAVEIDDYLLENALHQLGKEVYNTWMESNTFVYYAKMDKALKTR